MMIYPPKHLENFIMLINYELFSNYITAIFNIIRVTLALRNLTKLFLENKSKFTDAISTWLPSLSSFYLKKLLDHKPLLNWCSIKYS